MNEVRLLMSHISYYSKYYHERFREVTRLKTVRVVADPANNGLARDNKYYYQNITQN